VTPSSLKKKFKIWHINLPRGKNSNDRLCDTWLKVKLSKENKNTNKYRVNNINATYFLI
jgi:hypothetical protein